MTPQQQATTGATDPLCTLSEAVNQAIDIAMAEDPEVFVLGEDVEDPIGGVMKCTKGLSTKYGRDRVRNTPISEQAIVGAAIGASLVGMRPIAEIMLMDFVAVAMDQVANHAAKLRYMSGGRTNVPITIRTTVGGNRQFGAQHSQSLEGWMMHTPGLKVAVPSTPRDAKGLLTSCILDDDPCVHMETLFLLFTRGPVPAGRFAIPLGVAEAEAVGRRRHGGDLGLASARGPRRRRAAGRRGHQRGGHRHAHAGAPRHRRRVGERGADEAGLDRARGDTVRRPRRGDRVHRQSRALRRAGCAGRTDGIGVLADPLRQRAGELALPRAAAHRGGGSSSPLSRRLRSRRCCPSRSDR